ncbi:MAG: nuclear transport factor 2 family protein [Sphingomonadaceae bacterium]|jgi:hypothetical protein
MDAIKRLVASEAIRQAKAWYFYGLDHRDWAIWREKVWWPEGRLEVPEAEMVVEPLDRVIEWVSASVGDQVSVHHGHMPIIEFVSDSEAKVIWAMEDRLYRSPGAPLESGHHYLHGFGHYHETYTERGGEWRILSSRLTRLRVEATTIAGHPGGAA